MTAKEFISLFSKSTVSIKDPLEIGEDVAFDSTNFHSVTVLIENITFKGKVIVTNIPNVQELSFKKCSFNKGLAITNVTAKGYDPDALNFHNINIHECIIQGSLTVTNCEIERGIDIRSCELDKDNDRLIMSNTSISQGSIIIEGNFIDILHLSDLRIEGTGLRIEKSEIKNYLKCKSVSSSGGFSILKSIVHGHTNIWGGSVTAVTFNYNKCNTPHF